MSDGSTVGPSGPSFKFQVSDVYHVSFAMCHSFVRRPTRVSVPPPPVSVRFLLVSVRPPPSPSRDDPHLLRGADPGVQAPTRRTGLTTRPREGTVGREGPIPSSSECRSPRWLRPRSDHTPLRLLVTADGRSQRRRPGQ